MKRCTTVIEWLTYADGDFQCEENFNNQSAVRQLLKADRSPSISIDDALYDSHQKAVHNRWKLSVMVLAAEYTPELLSFYIFGVTY